MRGGLGSAVEVTASGIRIGALAIVNCAGEVIDPDTGDIVAGARGDSPGSFEPSLEIVRRGLPTTPFQSANSTLAVVATDAALTRDQAYRVAVIAQTGLARTIRPVHTPVDGDVVFALATGRNQEPAEVLHLGALAARAVERAILRGVTEATSFGAIPCVRDWSG
jgi:L-aminopeptidase/D-esterase-like protein